MGFSDNLQFLENIDADVLTKELQPIYHDLLLRFKKLFPDSYPDEQCDDDDEDDDSSSDDDLENDLLIGR